MRRNNLNLNKILRLIGREELLRSKFKRSTRKLTFSRHIFTTSRHLGRLAYVFNVDKEYSYSVYKVDIAKIMNVDINNLVKTT